MTPYAARSNFINKETLRYKIVFDAPIEEIKKFVLEHKSNNQSFEEPQTPYQADDILMVSIHRPDVLKMLIEECVSQSCNGLNTDVNASNSFGKTALMYASQYGFRDSVKILLDAGANINQQTQDANMEDEYCSDSICITNGKRTALMYAVQEGFLDIAKYLVEQGANPDIKDSKQMTVYDYLNGKAPYFGNFRIPPTEAVNSFRVPEKIENKKVTPEQVVDFTAFLNKAKKTQQAD